MLRCGGARPVFGIVYVAPDVKKSARNAFAGVLTANCGQSRNGFAATYKEYEFFSSLSGLIISDFFF